MNALDKHSFEKLFKDNFKGMVRFCMMYVKDYETAKELVQDSFISLWEKKDTIDISKPVKSYLASIVYNKSLNYLRDNKKYNKEIIDFEGLSSVDCFQKYDAVELEELQININTSINELPEKCKEVFMLSRFENLKYQEIADKLGISIKTVEAQISKALAHLREKLAAYLQILILIFFIR